MKKFWMLSMLLIAALFFVSCGGDDDEPAAQTDTGDTAADTGDTDADTGDTDAARECEEKAMQCSGNMSQLCKDGRWVDLQECIGEQKCDPESGECRGGRDKNWIDGNTAYNAPYGSVTLNISNLQVYNNSDTEYSPTQASFATGTLGNNGNPLVPANAYATLFYAMYEGQVYDTEPAPVSIQQIPFFQTSAESASQGNPVVYLYLYGNVAVGDYEISYNKPGDHAEICVADLDLETGHIKCFHACGEGQLTITSAGDVKNHGTISLTGSAAFYSPANYNGLGDKAQEFGMIACDPL